MSSIPISVTYSGYVKYTSEHTHRESMESESTNDSKQHMGDKSESKYNGKYKFHLVFYIIMSIFCFYK